MLLRAVHSIFSVICYVIFIMIYMGIFCPQRKMSKKYRNIIIVAMVAFFSIWIFSLYNYFLVKMLGEILVYSLFLWWLYDVRYFKSLALTVIFFGGCGTIDYLILIIIMNTMPKGSLATLSAPLGSSLVEVFSEIIHLFIIIILVRCFKKSTTELLNTKEWLRFAVCPIVSIITIVMFLVEFDVAQNENQKMAFLLVAIGLVVMNIILYFLLNDILKREAALREDRIFKTRAEREIQMYHSLAESFEKQRKIQHEYKNHLFSISALVREEKYEELSRYLSDLNHEVAELVNVIDVNNAMINALLNAKYQEMQAKGIILIPQINDLSRIPVSDEDIVVILANLLNNAIEACEDSVKKTIKLKFIHDEKGVLLSVINTYAKAPVMNGDKFLTTKTELPELHGIGIHNVKEMVAKYGGESVIKVTEEEFCFIILIPSKSV